MAIHGARGRRGRSLRTVWSVGVICATISACAGDLVPRLPAACEGGVGCADSEVPPFDAALDAGEFDASEFDASEVDADTADSGILDADVSDSSDFDAGIADAGDEDEGLPDLGASPCTWSSYGEGITGGQVSWVGFEPGEPARIWATTPSRVMRAAAGTTWAEVASPGISLTSLALSREGLPIVAASADGLRRSDDDGATWRVGALGGLSVTSVVRSAADARVVFASTSGGGFFVSSDGGTIWRSAGFGLSPSAVIAVAPDPRDAREVIAGGPYLNATGGWSDTGFVARSVDGGLTYSVVFAETGRTQALARCASDPNVLFSGHVYGLARSRDGGRTFARVAPTTFGNVAAIAMGGSACELVYVSRFGLGVMRSRDGGDTWEGPLREGMTLIPGTAPRGLSVDPADGQHVMASSSGGLFETFDGGATWAPVAGVGTPVLRAARASESDPGALWLATSGIGAWLRVPGDVWRFVPGIARDAVNSVREDTAGRVFSMGYRSTDRTTFTNPGPMGNVFDVAVDPRTPDVVWAVTQTLGIWRSNDGGVSFTPSNGGLTPWVTPVGTFVDARAVLVTDAGVFVGTQGRGLARSTDDGVSFVLDPTTDGLRISCLESLGDLGVAACVADGGFLLSRDGSAWSPWNEGLASLTTMGVVRDPRSGTVYASTTEGVYVRGTERWEPLEPGCLRPGLGAPTIQHEADGRSFLVVPAPESLIVRRPI